MSVVHANTVAAMRGHMLQIWGAKFQSSHNRKMAIPTLAAMAALTLLHNPHVLSEDDALDFGDFDAYASKLQAAIRGYLSRATTFLGKLSSTRRLQATRDGRRLPQIREHERGSRGWEFFDRALETRAYGGEVPAPRLLKRTSRLRWARRYYMLRERI